MIALRRNRSRLVCAALLAASAPFAAPPAGAGDLPRVEATPYYGWRMEGSFDNIDAAGISSLEIQDASAYGLILSFNVDPHGQIDVQYSNERTELQAHGSGVPGGTTLFDLDVENWQVGGTYAWSEPDKPVRGYVGFSVGLTRFEPHGSAFDGDSEFAFSFYGGARIRLAKHLGIRLQGQWIATRISSSSEVFCSSAGFCYVTVDGELLDQFELAAGLTIKF
jgi:Outer membrane protein beta-barrel domain